MHLKPLHPMISNGLREQVVFYKDWIEN